MRPIGDHFYTTSAAERDNAVANFGYVFEGIACFVPLPLPEKGQVPFYRLYHPTSGDHFYTTAAAERDSAIVVGYVSEGIACEVFSSLEAGTTQLHRLYNPTSGDHFYTTSAAERDAAVASSGYVSEGVACFVPTTGGAGTTQFHRLYNPTSGDHFYTTSAAERDAAIANSGYISEGVACFVLTAQISSRVSLFRLYNNTSGDHFYTTSASEQQAAIANSGYVAEGVACDVFASPGPNTIPLHRLFHPVSGDHFYTTSAAERDNAVTNIGYLSEGIACHVLPEGPNRLPLFRLFKKFGAAFDVNVILVGNDNFTTAHINQTIGSLAIARSIFGAVGLQIRGEQWFGIPSAQAGSLEIIDSGSEADELRDDWSVFNGALDLFVVRMETDADGRSAIDGSCDKAGKKSGSVVSLNGPTANSGNTFAHEMGHFLGLEHNDIAGNFMDGNDGASNSFTGIEAWQGEEMDDHCFVYDV